MTSGPQGAGVQRMTKKKTLGPGYRKTIELVSIMIDINLIHNNGF